ncbi:hypothetical protein [Spirillospora albida]|uniref:hypothetical protein n=1 Tax=Spirillospora albida TaxID=58123 RepID=UPI0012F7B224|nr:hypothetical protein [Spirillospora albida]
MPGPLTVRCPERHGGAGRLRGDARDARRDERAAARQVADQACRMLRQQFTAIADDADREQLTYATSVAKC